MLMIRLRLSRSASALSAASMTSFFVSAFLSPALWNSTPKSINSSQSSTASYVSRDHRSKSSTMMILIFPARQWANRR